MAIRLIEILLPKLKEAQAEEVIQKHTVHGVWTDAIDDDRILLKLLVDSTKTEPLLDDLERRFSGLDPFRIIMLPVEVVLPRPEEDKEEEKAAPKDDPVPWIPRISRQELYDDLNKTTELTLLFVILAMLSATVAAVGLMRDNVAVIIGAMVIAPLLGPNVALSLATALADFKLGLRAAKANVVGIVTVLAFSVLVGLIFRVDPDVREIISRTVVGPGDIVLALAAGVAGALAFTTAASSSLIGVMVAVALVPPLVCFGMLLGAGHVTLALGALHLTAINIICVNLAGVTTFLAQGIRPRRWWKADAAKKATRIAIVLWVILLSILGALIFLSQRK